MLKIKDNVDLKELEKYDIEFQKIDNYFYKKINNMEQRIRIKPITRDIAILTTTYVFNLDTLYDLIKADLVEKVED